MLEFDARFTWNRDSPARKLPGRLGAAHAALDSQIMKDTDPYVPFRTGATASSPMRGSSVGVIRYTTPYASRIYYGVGFNFRKTFHPQATHHWLEKSKAIWMKAWTRIVVRLLTRGMGP